MGLDCQSQHYPEYYRWHFYRRQRNFERYCVQHPLVESLQYELEAYAGKSCKFMLPANLQEVLLIRVDGTSSSGCRLRLYSS